MKTKALIITIVVLLIIGISVRPKSTSTTEDILKVGAIAPLTGGISVLGERMVRGLEIAKEDLVATGVVDSLEVIYEDACLAKESINAVQKLVLADKVSMIASSFCLPGIDAITPFTEKHEVLLFNTAANPESVIGKDYVFSTNFAIPSDALHIGKYVAEELEASRVAIVHFDSSFGESYRNALQKYFKEVGVEIVAIEAKTLDATDFRTEVTKIKATEPDVLLYFHFGSALGTLIKQTREIGMDAPIVSHYEAEDPTVVEFAQGGAEGMIVSSSQPEVKTEKVLQFEQKYFERYGEIPDVLATNAYDALILQVEHYVACDGDTTCIAKKLEKVSNYDGVSGNITINKDHSVEKPNIFKVVKGGKFVELE